jgi:GH24 family phage-related lysozyme (muramidase)
MDQLTARGALELVGHEAIVLEWYKDSSGIGTWGIGVTNNSGHNVDRYKDKPTTVERALEVFIWLLRNRYMPDVVHAFQGHPLTEGQFAAALSFHYNTGRIASTDWVGLWKAGHLQAAEDFLKSHYLNGGVLAGRRKAEADLFFHNVWSYGGMATIYPVLKPSYQPDFRHPQRVDIGQAMTQAITA